MDIGETVLFSIRTLEDPQKRTQPGSPVISTGGHARGFVSPPQVRVTRCSLRFSLMVYLKGNVPPRMGRSVDGENVPTGSPGNPSGRKPPGRVPGDNQVIAAVYLSKAPMTLNLPTGHWGQWVVA